MEILGVRIDNLPKEEILLKVKEFLCVEKFHQIITINPEFILTAQNDAEFKNILNQADLNVADGVGLNLPFWRKKGKLKFRFTGADLVEEILQAADKNKLSLYLVCDSRGLSAWEEVRKSMIEKYPKLRVGGADMDKIISIDNEKNTDFLNYDIVFCNFGAPYQEKFLDSLKNRGNAKIRLCMGVGGSFDFLTGKIKRAPKSIRSMGLEWLWRLMLEPRYRFKRIFRAVVIFPIKIIFNK